MFIFKREIVKSAMEPQDYSKSTPEQKQGSQFQVQMTDATTQTKMVDNIAQKKMVDNATQTDTCVTPMRKRRLVRRRLFVEEEEEEKLDIIAEELGCKSASEQSEKSDVDVNMQTPSENLQIGLDKIVIK